MILLRTISVTREDINKGCPTNSYSCAVALAVQRVVADHFEVRVGPSSIALYYRDGRPRAAYRASTPSYLGNWIRAFDDKREVKPIAADLTFRPV